MNEVFDWYVGIDWASAVHGERAVRHTGEERAALAAWLIETTGAAPERIEPLRVFRRPVWLSHAAMATSSV
jgi:hypothetical protein